MSYKTSSGIGFGRPATQPAGQRLATQPKAAVKLCDRARMEMNRNTPQQNSNCFTQSTLIHTKTGHIAVDRSTRQHQLEDDEEQEQSENDDEEKAYQSSSTRPTHQNSSSRPPKQAPLSRSNSSNRRNTSSSGATTSGVSSKDDDGDGDGRKRKHRVASTVLGISRNVTTKITKQREEICTLIPSNVESKNAR